MIYLIAGLSIGINIALLVGFLITALNPERTILAGLGWKECDSCHHTFPSESIHSVSADGKDEEVCDGCLAGYVTMEIFCQAIGQETFNEIMGPVGEYMKGLENGYVIGPQGISVIH